MEGTGVRNGMPVLFLCCLMMIIPRQFVWLFRGNVVPLQAMKRETFEAYLKKYAREIEQIRLSAHELHEHVNQTYGDNLPYGYHLDMVVNGVCDFGHLVCAGEGDVLPLFFGAYYHDSIEDARLTYNDVMRWPGASCPRSRR